MSRIKRLVTSAVLGVLFAAPALAQDGSAGGKGLGMEALSFFGYESIETTLAGRESYQSLMYGVRGAVGFQRLAIEAEYAVGDLALNDTYAGYPNYKGRVGARTSFVLNKFMRIQLRTGLEIKTNVVDELGYYTMSSSKPWLMLPYAGTNLKLGVKGKFSLTVGGAVSFNQSTITRPDYEATIGAGADFP